MDRDQVSREGADGIRVVGMLLSQFLLQGLAVAVPHNLKQRNGHGEDHPDVNHLHVGRRWKRTRDSNVTANFGVMNLLQISTLISTHNVARTRRAVRLTPITMSK